MRRPPRIEPVESTLLRQMRRSFGCGVSVELV
jgi:hypothetical protein